MLFRYIKKDDASLAASAIASVFCESGASLTRIQATWLDVIFGKLLDFDFDLTRISRIVPTELRFQWHDVGRRQELVEFLVSLELLSNPISECLSRSVEHWALALGIDHDAIDLVRELARHHHRRATRAWYRLSWFGRKAKQNEAQMRQIADHGVMAIALTLEPDPSEALRWRNLNHCPDRSIGQALYQLLESQDIGFPGEVGATHSTLALHDWIHVITNLPVSPLGEIATAAYIAASSQTPEATLAFLGTISIFEASLLQYHLDQSVDQSPAGLIGYSGALSTPEAMQYVATAIQSGHCCPVDPIRDLDFFSIAHLPLEEVRRSWGLPAGGLPLFVP